MRIAILCGGGGWHVRDLLRAASEANLAVECVDFRTLNSGVAHPIDPLAGFDRVMVRTMPPGSLEQVVFRMDLLHTLNDRGVPVLNSPRALETCIDKYLSLVRLQAIGLPVPPTVCCQTVDEALRAFDALGRDVVVKPLFGSEGRGLVRVSEPELAWRTFHAIDRTQAVLYLQKFIPHPGWDVRAFVLRGRVVAAMRRTSQGDWRTNVAQGARAEKAQLDSEQESIAIQAAMAVDAVAAGVDLLPGPDGKWYVVEVNAVPGWKALAPVTGVDIAKELLNFLVEARCSLGDLASYLQLACLWEATARKAGNVHPEARFADVSYSDFVLSASAVAGALSCAPTKTIGQNILNAVAATKSAVGTNTNLGIVLMLAPLAMIPDWAETKSALRAILQRSTVHDCQKVYEAIRLASPGGMGKTQEADIADVPTITLLEAMSLAADRDQIARQYANGFADVLDFGVPALITAFDRFQRLEPAIQSCQLAWLARFGDTLIARKRGAEEASETRRRAADVIARGGLATTEGRTAYAELDLWLREVGHARNPGTTADLVTACLFVALRERKIKPDARM